MTTKAKDELHVAELKGVPIGESYSLHWQAVDTSALRTTEINKLPSFLGDRNLGVEARHGRIVDQKIVAVLASQAIHAMMQRMKSAVAIRERRFGFAWRQSSTAQDGLRDTGRFRRCGLLRELGHRATESFATGERHR